MEKRDSKRKPISTIGSTMQTETETLLTRKAIARRFQVTPRTVDRWRAKGFLQPPAVILAGLPRWLPSQVECLGVVDNQRQGETPI